MPAYAGKHVDEFAGPLSSRASPSASGEVDVSELGCGGEREAAFPL